MSDSRAGFTGRIFRIALPLILQQLCLQLQIWIDRAMLGHMDALYFSAVGNALVPYQAASSMIVAVCGGTAILTAQKLGSGDREGLRQAAECSFLGNSLISAAAFLFFFLCSGWLFGLMGVQSPVFELSLSYIRILSFSLLILGPVSTGTAVLQGLGLTKMIMLSGLAGNILNIVLDWILIYGRLGFPQLGIKGAALATVLANLAAAPMLLLYTFKSPKLPVRIRISAVKLSSLRQYKSVFRLGAPSGMEFALWNMGNVILVSYLNRLDIMAAGIYTLVFSIETFPLLIYSGFANAALTLVGQKTGEGCPLQARRAGFMCLGWSLMVCLGAAVLFRGFPGAILSLFTDDASMIGLSTPFMAFVAWILFPKAFNAVIGPCIRGTGDTRWMLYTQIFGSLFMVGAGYLLVFGFNMGLWGIFITLLADEAIRGVVNTLRFVFNSTALRPNAAAKVPSGT